jgi:hypothetical protein
LFAMRRVSSSSSLDNTGSAVICASGHPDLSLSFSDRSESWLSSDDGEFREGLMIVTDRRSSYAEFHGRRWFALCAAKVGRGVAGLYAVPKQAERAVDPSKTWVLDARTARVLSTTPVPTKKLIPDDARVGVW